MQDEPQNHVYGKCDGGGKSSFLIAVFIKALLKVTNKDSKTITIRKAVA